MSPVLPGGVTDELLDSWAYWYSQATKAIAAGQTVDLPDTPDSPGQRIAITTPALTGMSLLEGPGLAYSVERNNTVAYAASQQQITKVTGKQNPWHD